MTQHPVDKFAHVHDKICGVVAQFWGRVWKPEINAKASRIWSCMYAIVSE